MSWSIESVAASGLLKARWMTGSLMAMCTRIDATTRNDMA